MPDRSDTELIAELRRLNEARTQGTWTEHAWLRILLAMMREDAQNNISIAALLVHFPESAPQAKADAAFIAASANAIPRLLALAESALTAQSANYRVGCSAIRADALREAAEIARQHSSYCAAAILARIQEKSDA